MGKLIERLSLATLGVPPLAMQFPFGVAMHSEEVCVFGGLGGWPPQHDVYEALIGWVNPTVIFVGDWTAWDWAELKVVSPPPEVMMLVVRLGTSPAFLTKSLLVHFCAGGGLWSHSSLTFPTESIAWTTTCSEPSLSDDTSIV